MTDQPTAPGVLRIVQTDVYYDPDSGDIVHVHRIAVPTEESIDAQRIAEETAVFAESLVQRHGRSLPMVTVDEEVLLEAISPDVMLKVDIEHARVVRA